MGKNFKNPPVVESIFEIRLDKITNWDITFIGQFYNLIKESYPIKNQKKEINIQIRNEGQSNLVTVDRMQFYNSDKSSLIQLDEELFTINQLKPYKSWDDYYDKIKYGYDKFKRIADYNKITRIGLQYINIIDLGKIENLEEYFNIYPQTNYEIDYDRFVVGVVSPQTEANGDLRIEISTQRAEEPNINRFILSLDHFINKPDFIEDKSLFKWIEESHTTIENNFLSIITDKLKTHFNN